jgi:hypothetical protein
VFVSGLLLAAFALTMATSVHVPERDLGYGLTTPVMEVTNVDLTSKRQSYLIVAGFLAVSGAVLLGFSSLSATKISVPVSRPLELPDHGPSENAQVVTICPKCRYMGKGDAVVCARCDEPFTGNT